MHSQNELLLLAQQRLQLPTYAALSRALGLRDATVSSYMTRGTGLGDDVCYRVAQILEMDPIYVIACVRAEHAKTERVKRVWLALLQRLGAAAAAALLAVTPALAGYAHKSAPQLGISRSLSASAPPSNIHYAHKHDRSSGRPNRRRGLSVAVPSFALHADRSPAGSRPPRRRVGCR